MPRASNPPGAVELHSIITDFFEGKGLEVLPLEMDTGMTLSYPLIGAVPGTHLILRLKPLHLHLSFLLNRHLDKKAKKANK